MKKLYSFLCLAVLFLFSVTVSAQVLIPENFEGATFPADWGQASSPAVILTTTTPCEGSQSARMPISSGNAQASLRSAIQTATGDDIEVSFTYKIINQTGGTATPTTFGSLELQYTTDGNSVNPVWTTYATIDGTNHTSSTSCAPHTATIPAASVPAGSDFAWRVRVNWAVGSYYVYIDDFLAVEQVDCIEPIYVEVDNVTFDEADVSWVDLNGASSWEIEYGPVGFPAGLGFGVIVTTTTNPHTLTGLDDGVSYDVYVRAVCGPGDESNWAGPFNFQTIAIGTDCATPLQVVTLPYNHSGDTQIYGDSYSGSPGNGCIGNNYLEGNEVVYTYTPTVDDYLNVKVSDLVGEDNVGIFIYESCADIGNNCYAGEITSTGSDIEFDVFVEGGQDYYFVLSTSGANTTTLYTLDINGFDCPSFGAPDGLATYEFFGQSLAAFDDTRIGVEPTNDFAHLVWYEDNAGVPGAVIPNTGAINLVNNAVYHVNQVLGTCESAFLMVTFTEFDCLGQLAILTTDTGAEICAEGTTTLGATAATSNLFWYDTEFGGEVRGTGNTFETDVIDVTTSYWVAEAFVGEGNLSGQANPGPTSATTSTANNGVLIGNISSDFTIVDVQVFSTGAGGTTTVTLIDESGSTADQTVSVSIPSGSAAVPVAYTIPLDFDLESGKTYRMLKTAGPSMLYSSSGTYPYNVGTVAEVTDGATAGGSTNSYYYFYNWTISEEQPLCESPRTEVIATVNEVFNIIPTTTNANVCVGQQANLTVSSTDTDYVYTWTWMDPLNGAQTQTGANIQPTIVQNTTFSVTGHNPVTNCTSTTETISIQAIGAGEIPVTPDVVAVCVGEIVELTAGGVYNTFEDLPTGWAVTNSSTGPGNPAGAAWKLVNSPYNPAEGATSNDNSQFYLATASEVGPTGLVNTQLTSPSFNLVGVQNATLSFYHYYKHSQIQNTEAKVEVSVGNGPWINLQTYGATNTSCLPITCNQGAPTDFEHVTINLSSYTGAADVRIRFDYTGKWGWWWAVDNVTISRDYTNGQVTWVSSNDLFLDENATIPYAGTSTNKVYFKSDIPGTFNYQVELDIVGCSQPVTTPVTITVSETMPPTGPAQQDYIVGETLFNLDVTGQNLRYYVFENGQYVQISPNFLLRHGITYYITQTLNDCESDYLEVTVSLDCPAPIDVDVLVDVDVTGNTAAVLITWTPPTNVISVQSYAIEITDSSGAMVFKGTAAGTADYRIIQGLAFDEEFEMIIYSVCDPQVPVNSNSETLMFNTNGLDVESRNFDGFTYYPNPTNSVVTFLNTAPIRNIEVFNMAGQKVLDMNNIDNNKVVIDFEALPTGVYFSKVSVGDSVQVVRIIRE